MKIFHSTILSFLLFSLSLFAASVDDQMAEVNKLYNDAISLMKEDHKGNAPVTLKILKKARNILFSMGELSEEHEAKLIKINSHIYWQSKFSSAFAKYNDDEEEETEKLTLDKPKVNDEEWEKVKEQKRAVFNESYEETKEYEEKHSKDLMSNMLNYLDLQTKAVDSDAVDMVFDKTEYYHVALKDERIKILKGLLKNFSDYESLVANKKYSMVLSRLKKLSKGKSLTIKQKGFLSHLIKEVNAMNLIMSALLQHG
ncbi:MAG: hypothetical protein HQL32_08255, partial [Planctomycetes bacterium]|nr:hypothetical protein [Planctomycetota bacterium]